MKPREDYYGVRKRSGWCKVCSRAKSAAYYAANKERQKAKHREWVAANKERVAAHKAKSAYGIPLDEYEQLMHEGKCAICGNTELLLRGYLGELSSDQRDTLEVIRMRAEQMRDLVNNFVMIASIEANTLITEPEPQDVWVAIESALAPMRSAFLKKGIDIHLDLPDTLPPVHADRQQLQIVLTQLLDNARRYTMKGSVTVRARHVHDTVQIDIVDTGPGISSEEFTQLFTRFHRVEGNNSPERGGGPCHHPPARRAPGRASVGRQHPRPGQHVQHCTTGSE
jgi:signal transduction histidine kinase